MTKLTGAALDRAVAHAMGVKSVHDCEKWVGLTGQEKALIASVSLDVHDAIHRTNAKLRQKNS